MKKLNKSQQKILDYLRERSQDGVPPSVREICAATGLKSTSTVHAHLKALEENGFISRDAGLNRAIHISGVERSVQVPVLGRVTAGLPILAVEDVEGYLPINESQCRGRELFALRVVGESMINAGIFNGDNVLVKKQPNAENGDIVVALVDDSATVKTFYKEDGYYRLQPENDTMDPIIVKECSILGKVFGVFRFL